PPRGGKGVFPISHTVFLHTEPFVGDKPCQEFCSLTRIPARATIRRRLVESMGSASEGCPRKLADESHWHAGRGAAASFPERRLSKEATMNRLTVLYGNP